MRIPSPPPRIVGALARKRSKSERRLGHYLLVLLVPLLLTFVGALGYHLIEDWSWMDSLYMTVITISTVGFAEVHPLSPAGRAFTLFMIAGGVFTVFFTATEFIRAVVNGELQTMFGRQRMERMLEENRDHIIVCGYGRMGRLVGQEFSAAGLPFVIIDRVAPLLENFELPHGVALVGDATNDEVLKRAGVARARALLTLAASDADNLFITMSARLLNDKIFIVSRSDDEQAQTKLLRAGANRVILPYVIGGQRVAQAVLRPTVMDFLELATRSEHLELQIEQAAVGDQSPLAGSAVRDAGIRNDLGIIVVAIKKAGGRMVFNPAGDVVMESGDELVALGPREQLDRLQAIAQGGARA